MFDLAFITGSAFWDFMFRRPFMFFIGYIPINVIVVPNEAMEIMI